MRVWQVIANDTQIRFWWFETKKEAIRFARNYQKENSDDGPCDVEVKSQEFDGGRKGIVEALNHVISLTCFNEG